MQTVITRKRVTGRHSPVTLQTAWSALGGQDMTLERFDVMSLPAARRWAADHPERRTRPDDIGVRLGGLAGALSLGRLFWPEFIEVEGCVLIRDHYERSNFERWQAHFSGNIPEIERMINLVDLEDMYDAVEDDLDEATASRVLDELSRVISRTWAAALRDNFPDRRFSVGRSPGNGGDYPVVWFHSETPLPGTAART